MTGRWSLAAVGVVLICLTLAAALLLSWQRQAASLERAVFARDRLASDIGRYVAAASRGEDSLFGTKPATDIERRFAQALSAAGVTPAPRFAVSVQEDREQRSGVGRENAGLREQRVSLRIPSLSVKQIGDVLARWVSQQHVWKPARIELSHEERSEQNRYTLHLECVAVYRDNGRTE